MRVKLTVLLLLLAFAPIVSAQDVPLFVGIAAYAPVGTCPEGVHELEWVGENALIESHVHSNGDFLLEGTPSSPAEMHGDTTISGSNFSNEQLVEFDTVPIEGAPVEPFVPLVDLDYYNPNGDGRIYNALRNDIRGQVNYVDGDWDVSLLPSFVDEFGNPQTELEGLYYVAGNVERLTNSPAIGSEGITIVAEGYIHVANLLSNFYTGLLEIRATDGLPYPGLFLASDYDAGGGCDDGVNDSGIYYSDSGLTVYGILYAPDATVTIEATHIYLRGAIQAWRVDGSGADITFIYEDTLIPSHNPPWGFDVNKDRYITPADVIYVINRFGSRPCYPYRENPEANMNSDCIIDSADALAIIEGMGW